MTKRKKVRITKEWLQQLGIVDVSKDGVVTGKNGNVKIWTITTKHPYGKDRSYHAIWVYDKELYKERKKSRGRRCLLLSRVLYAWYNDVCPENFDVDHIDNNPLNDTLDNLRLLSREENNRRHLPRNKQLASIPSEELEDYLMTMKTFKRQSEEAREYVDAARADMFEAQCQLRDVRKKFKNGQLDYINYESLEALWKNTYKNAREKFEETSDTWHTINKQAREFKQSYLSKVKERE